MSDFTRTKYIVYVILAVVVLGIVWFAYYRYLSPVTPGVVPQQQPGISGKTGGGGPGAPPETNPPAATSTLPVLPSITEQKLTRLTDFSVISPSLNKNETQVLFYKKDGGDLFAVDFHGTQQEKVAHVTVVGLTEALWPVTRDRAAVFYLSGDTLKGFLHIGTSSIAVLPQDIRSFSWSPDGRSLAYLVPKDDLMNLVIADASGKNPKTVFRTPLADAKISWVGGDKIAFQTAPSAMSEGFIFTFSRSTGAFTKVYGPAFGLQSRWSADGSQILVSQTSRGGGHLTSGIYHTVKKTFRTLDAPTLPEKCAWADANELYCALPRSIPSDVIMPDDYLRGEYNSADRIVRIAADKNGAADVFSEGSFDMSNLSITKNKNFLFFVNRNDGTLWSLRLK